MRGTRAPVEAAGDDGLAIVHSERVWLEASLVVEIVAPPYISADGC